MIRSNTRYVLTFIVLRALFYLVLMGSVLPAFSVFAAPSPDFVYQATHSVDDAAAAKIYASVKKPETLLEALRNLKVIIDNNLMMRDDFYTQEKMNQFFAYGALRIHCFAREGYKAYCSNSNHLRADTQNLNTPHSPYIKFSISRSLTDSGDIYIDIPNRTTFAEVLSIFGDKFYVSHNYKGNIALPVLSSDEPVPDIEPPLAREVYRKSLEEPLILAKESSHGEATIRYEFAEPATVASTLVFFILSNKILHMTHYSFHKIVPRRF